MSVVVREVTVSTMLAVPLLGIASTRNRTGPCCVDFRWAQVRRTLEFDPVVVTRSADASLVAASGVTVVDAVVVSTV